MMKETILWMNFTDKDRRNKLAKALLPLRIKMREITREDYGRAVGDLAGKKELQKEIVSGNPQEAQKKNAGRQEELSGEFLVMAGLSGPRIDQVLRAIRKAGISIPYKAVLTEYNQNWNIWELFEEIKKEHQKMTGEEASPAGGEDTDNGK